MRLGVAVDPGAGAPGDLARTATRADAIGLDVLWLDGGAQRPGATTTTAAWLAGTTGSIAVGGAVPLGESHPMYVAEEIAVADQLLGGRLVPAAVAATGTGPDLAEAVELLLHAAAPRPFRSNGPRWPVPADLPENGHGRVTRVRVTPPRPGVSPALWMAGAPAVADRFGLPALRVPGDPDGHSADRSVPGRARPVLVDSGPDPTSMLAAIRSAAADGHDTVLLRLPPALDLTARLRSIDDLARRVRPRVQLDDLPPGLAEFWDRSIREESHA